MSIIKLFQRGQLLFRGVTIIPEEPEESIDYIDKEISFLDKKYNYRSTYYLIPKSKLIPFKMFVGNLKLDVWCNCIYFSVLHDSNKTHIDLILNGTGSYSKDGLPRVNYDHRYNRYKNMDELYEHIVKNGNNDCCDIVTNMSYNSIVGLMFTDKFFDYTDEDKRVKLINLVKDRFEEKCKRSLPLFRLSTEEDKKYVYYDLKEFSI